MRLFFGRHLLFLLLPTVISISLPNLVPAGGILSLDNISHISNTSITANPSDPRLLPYTYHVPFTHITLFLGFSILKRQRLDGMELHRLILSAQGLIDGLVPINWSRWTLISHSTGRIG